MDRCKQYVYFIYVQQSTIDTIMDFQRVQYQNKAVKFVFNIIKKKQIYAMWFESQPCKSINFELEYPLIKKLMVSLFFQNTK